MPHVITDACIKDWNCVPSCQRKAIHPKKNEEGWDTVPQLYINPKKCLDCGTCVSICEQGAIFAIDDLPEEKAAFVDINANYFKN